MTYIFQPDRFNRTKIKQAINQYGVWVKNHLAAGWSGYFLTYLFNRLSGSQAQINRIQKSEIERSYSSLLTRLIRRPHAFDATRPILIASPDWPVPKLEKKTISEIITNDGLHHHGILLVAPPDRHYRLKIPVEDHLIDQQAYYTRDGLIKSLKAQPFPVTDAETVTDYALKGLKAGRNLDDESILLLPSTHRIKRPYIKREP